MSSHFNYEIDERSLRAKLKNLSFPYSEEAWMGYEEFSEANKKAYKAPVLPAVRLNLNRNVVLPAIFGVVIILFSMLLFNFVSIKRTAEVKTAKTAPQIPAPPKPQPQQAEQKAVPVVDTTKKSIPSDTVKTVVQEPPATQETVAAAAAPAVQQQTQAADLPVWTVAEAGEIYIDPNIKSQVIGASRRNQTYKALEETNYFIKVNFDNNGSPAVGFIRKTQAFKNGGAISGAPVHRKNPKPETLESMQPSVMLPTGPAEKEPELK